MVHFASRAARIPHFMLMCVTRRHKLVGQFNGTVVHMFLTFGILFSVHVASQPPRAASVVLIVGRPKLSLSTSAATVAMNVDRLMNQIKQRIKNNRRFQR